MSKAVHGIVYLLSMKDYEPSLHRSVDGLIQFFEAYRLNKFKYDSHTVDREGMRIIVHDGKQHTPVASWSEHIVKD